MNSKSLPTNPIWELLAALSQSMAFYSGDFGAFSRELCEGTQRCLNLSRASVWLIDTDQRVMRNSCLTCPHPVSSCQQNTLALEVARPLLNGCLHQRSFTVEDVATKFHGQELLPTYLVPHHVRSLTASLVRSGPEIVGVLILEHQDSRHAWQEVEAHLTGILADLLGHVFTLQERNRMEQAMTLHTQELEENVKIRTQDLQDVLENQKAMLRGLCHDIANSLNVISATCEIIVRKGEIRFVDRALQAVDLMKDMLNQTRSYCLFTDNSQRIHDQTTTRQQSFSLAEALDKALFILSDKARAKAVHLKVLGQVPGDLRVLGDPLTFLHSVIGNVLSNAIKFSPENGEVHLRLVTSGNRLGIAIRDHGVGMPPEKIQELQNAARKVKSEKGTANESGTGYGVVQVRHYLHKFGGQLIIESWQAQGSSGPPAGTEVTLWLNRAEPERQAA